MSYGAIRASIYGLALSFALACAAQAQSLSGLHIGDNVGQTASLGPAADKGQYKEYAAQRWKLANGNKLSVSSKADGTIAYIESDWGHESAGGSAGLFGFVFGQTTLNDIRKKLGSNGMAFKNRNPILETASNIVLLNSYEVGSAMVTFYTVIPKEDFESAKAAANDNEKFGSFAKLDAISIASGEYADKDWGDRILDPAYKKTPAPPETK
jgi:hypothetical protein